MWPMNLLLYLLSLFVLYFSLDSFSYYRRYWNNICFLYLMGNQTLWHQMIICLNIPRTYIVITLCDACHRYSFDTTGDRDLKLFLLMYLVPLEDLPPKQKEIIHTYTPKSPKPLSKSYCSWSFYSFLNKTITTI